MHVPLLIAAFAAASFSLSVAAQAHAASPRHVHAVHRHLAAREAHLTGRSVFVSPQASYAEPNWQRHFGF